MGKVERNALLILGFKSTGADMGDIYEKNNENNFSGVSFFGSVFAIWETG